MIYKCDKCKSLFVIDFATCIHANHLYFNHYCFTCGYTGIISIPLWVLENSIEKCKEDSLVVQVLDFEYRKQYITNLIDLQSMFETLNKLK